MLRNMNDLEGSPFTLLPDHGALAITLQSGSSEEMEVSCKL